MSDVLVSPPPEAAPPAPEPAPGLGARIREIAYYLMLLVAIGIPIVGSVVALLFY